MAAYDPRVFREVLEKFGSDLVDQMELYIQQEDFTHPGFYAALRDSKMPFGLMRAITSLSELLKIPHCHADYYAVVNRKIKELLKPFMAAYQQGLAYEAQALMEGEERDSRTKVIRSKPWRDKVRGLIDRGKSDDRDDSDDSLD